ncbi:hypothetical protein WJX74_001215 [Apatococcus lobatus]|uniref:Methyltransferase type 11 domain-containing protein n=1 Tax=Apatococcus lobatus TaxID=904363 RepID=A0AAW1RSP1_9CHLO
MSAGGYTSLFDDQAAAYSQFRPTYPQDLYDLVLEYAQLPQQQVCLDIATGQGQAAVELAKRFERVVAIEPNAKQLQHAVPAENITYREGSAEASGMPDASVDLVASAQACHWFELEPFWEEVRRILLPGGAFAVWGYDLVQVPGNAAATQVLWRMENVTLGPYWSDRRKLVSGHYRDCLPKDGMFADVKHVELGSPLSLTMQQIVGWVSTWSSYSTYKRHHPDGPDPLPAFQQELATALIGAQEDSSIKLNFPIFIILGKKLAK